MITLPPALAALAAYPQFVCWAAEPSRTRPGKTDKFPIDWRTGHVVSAHDPAAWTTFDIAAATHATYARNGHPSGVGFVFTAHDPFFFHDIDECLTPDGQWSPLALSILARFPGAAVEVSQSGRGLHIFGRTAPIEHGCKNTALHLELYTHSRFAALTGLQAQGDAGADCTAALHQLVADYFPPTARADGVDWTDGPVDGWDATLTDDAELLRRAMSSGGRSAAAVFGGADVTFAQLWQGDADALARKWPTQGNGAYDASSADQALAGHLAFWTGKDCGRMERLMRASALVREKWDAHATYLAGTITGACAFIRSVAQPQAQPVAATVPPPPPADVAAAAALHANRTPREPGSEYLHAHQQLDWFDGLYYMYGRESIYDLERDVELKRGAFDVLFGGHLFVMDPGSAKTTESAWQAYTSSRVYKPVIVSDLCFRPEMPTGALISEGAETLVNSYVAYEPRVLAGDPAPFLGLLERMLPDARDRAILLHWMARVARSPGRKIQWWPIIIGVQGNGKTTLLRIMKYIAGRKYSHLVNVEALAKTGAQFNDWIERKTFLGLEEIKASDKRELLEVLKPFVTNEELPVEGKGLKQTTGDNRANGMGTSNHLDGMPIDQKERRYGMFICAQKTEADLIRDGMNDAYFYDLRCWWDGTGSYAAHGADYGYAIVAGYLRSYELTAELDPISHSRAPITTGHASVVAASLGRVEQEVLDAIEEGRAGFAGGWVSSKYLDALIATMRGAAVPRAKRRDMMVALGYDWHPALTNGRTNAPVAPDAAKPKLYVRKGHVALGLTSPADVEKAYTAAQTVPAQAGAVVAFGKPA